MSNINNSLLMSESQISELKSGNISCKFLIVELSNLICSILDKLKYTRKVRYFSI